MRSENTFDIIGIGIGPFNLGLAALSHSIPQLQCLFIDGRDNFDWHPGLLLPNARLQVPFYADLVTLANPCSPFTYMAYLKAKKRMFRFAIHENYFVTRKEYNDYCKWVAAQLSSLRFNETCLSIEHETDHYVVTTTKSKYQTKNIAIGVGTVPHIPSFAKLKDKNIIHSGSYLFNKELLLKQPSITIIGSGQSAAEIFYDLLQCYGRKLHWFTRSPRFFPMEYSRLTLEMSSPDYINYFYSLDKTIKEKILHEQSTLYKGINFSLINEIYDALYLKSLDDRHQNIHLHTNCELKDLTRNNNLHLTFHHRQLNKTFHHETHAVILATGYKAITPLFIRSITGQINWDDNNRYAINNDYSIDTNHSIFVQNAEEHTHGFNAADLGLGPYRNATILNSILGTEHFIMEKDITFQTFG